MMNTELLTQQPARDLQWVLRSPALLAESDDLRIAKLEMPNEKDIDLEQLTEFLVQNASSRVGLYFERLLHFYLERVLHYEMLARQFQVNQAGRTIGELDFVVRDLSGRVLHLEAAVKFYLHFPVDQQLGHCNDSTGRTLLGSEFIGPNSADNLHRKYARMSNHQLRLGTMVRDDIELCQAISRGRIFFHPGQPRPDTLPPILSDQHLSATWIRCSELDWISALGEHRLFKVLVKPYWLSDEREVDTGNLLSSATLIEHLHRHFAPHADFKGSGRPVLFSSMKFREGSWQEMDRCFVVSDQWPYE